MYNKEIKVIKKAIKKACKKFLSDFHVERKAKGSFDYVTENDLACEKYLTAVIKKHFPKDNFLTEEFSHDGTLKDRTWIIDPIDGTINFMQGLPIYGLQMAFYDRGETQFAFIALPTAKELYFAQNGCGAYLNGKQIVVDKNVEMANTIVCTSDPKHNDADYDFYFRFAKAVATKTLCIRMLGAACCSYSAVASSKVGAYVLVTNNEWDYMPGMLICKEAGAVCLSGTILSKKYNIACCNENLGKFLVKNMK